MSPRWRKVLKDLWGNKARTLLAVLSIAAGVFAVGTISTAYFAIRQDIDATYAAIHPAHGVITAEPFDEELVKVVERLPGVETAEGRVVLGNMSLLQGADKKQPMTMAAVETLAALRLDQLRLLSGNWPGKLEMVVAPNPFAQTGAAAQAAFPQTGDTVQVELPDGRIRTLRISGVVQDQNNGSSSLTLAAYVDLQTLDALGLPRTFNRLLFRVLGTAPTEAEVRAAGQEIESRFSRSDITIFQSLVRQPDQHPMRAGAAGMLGVMVAIGFMLLAMGGFLVANIILALLAQQVRQIGIMKAVGARSGQIAGMYLTLSTSFGALALVVAAPVAPLAGYALAQLTASLLNFAPQEYHLFPASLLLMLAVGLLVPWVAALLPVLNVMHVSTHTALTTYGTGAEVSHDWIDRLVERFRGLSRPLLISLRNLLRRKERLGLTLSALAFAGAAFMSIFTARASIIRSFDLLLPLYFADLNLDFDRVYRTEAIFQAVKPLPGVVDVEAWATTTAELRDAAGREILERFTIVAPPAHSRFIRQPPVTAGRWLEAGDQNALVISTQIVLNHPELSIGDALRLRINGRDVPFVIVGKFTWVQGDLMAYASYAYISALLGETGRARTYRVMTTSSLPALEDAVGARVSEALKERGYTPVITTGAAGRGMVAAGADGVAVGIMFMALLAVAVGGVGLAGTMSMNVLERTREIGVMRAIGASNGAVRRIVVTEGVMVGLLSWLIALGLSFPLSCLICVGEGLALLKRPLDYVYNWEGVVIWLGLVIAISAAASLWPAINAGRLTVRDALAYE